VRAVALYPQLHGLIIAATLQGMAGAFVPS
jgi:hypothetical protein